MAGWGACNGRTRLPTASPPPPRAHHNPCPGTLYRYTLLLYGTAEDMTARPSDPQVTSNACVQRDTEGLCQGECPARHGPFAGRWQQGQCACACAAWGEGAGRLGWQVSASQPHGRVCPSYRVPQPRLHPGPPLPRLLPAKILQPHPAGGDRWTRALSRACHAGLLQLPLVLLHLPRKLPAGLHCLPSAVRAGRAAGLLLRTLPP